MMTRLGRKTQKPLLYLLIQMFGISSVMYHIGIIRLHDLEPRLSELTLANDHFNHWGAASQ